MSIRICKKCFYEINEKGVNGMHKECFYNIRILQCIKCEMPLICFHQKYNKLCNTCNKKYKLNKKIGYCCIKW